MWTGILRCQAQSRVRKMWKLLVTTVIVEPGGSKRAEFSRFSFVLVARGSRRMRSGLMP